MTLAILLFSATVSVLTFLQLSQYHYLFGHDIYFHYHISTLILDSNLSYIGTVTDYWNGIKYGYPPVLHISTATVTHYFGIELVNVYRFLPTLMSGLLTLLVYLFLKVYKVRSAFLGTVIFVASTGLLIPIYQGEYARLLGFGFTLLGLIYLNKFSQVRNMLYFVISSTSLALAVMSNLISALFIGSIAIYFLWNERNTPFKKQSISIFFVALVISSIWWLQALINFEWNYFIRVLSTHQKTNLTLPIGIVAVCTFLFEVYYRNRKPHLLLVWFWLGSVLIAPIYFLFPLSVGIGQLAEKLINKKNRYSQVAFNTSLSVVSLLLYLTYTNGTLIYNDSFMNQEVIEAATWINENTDENSTIMGYFTPPFTPYKFAMTSTQLKTSLSNRDVSLPPLTSRKTYSWMGYEWNTDPQHLETYAEFQKKLCKSHFVEVAVESQMQPTYLWLNKDSPEYFDQTIHCSNITEPYFTTVYENKRIRIIKPHWKLLLPSPYAIIQK